MGGCDSKDAVKVDQQKQPAKVRKTILTKIMERIVKGKNDKVNILRILASKC